MTTTALTTIEPRDVAPASEPRQAFNLENIFQLAIEKQGAAETLERLMAIRREMNAEAAKQAFDMALTRFQSECPVIAKDKAVMNKDGRSVRYHFAPLDSILKQVQPILQKHGFSFRFTTQTNNNKVKVCCVASHQAGHAEPSDFESPIDPQAFMNEQQKFAAALTYAKRYAFCNAFGILTGDEDVDGETKKPKPEGPSSIANMKEELWRLLGDICAGDKDWVRANRWLHDENVIADTEQAPKFTAARFQQVITKAKEKLQ